MQRLYWTVGKYEGIMGKETTKRYGLAEGMLCQGCSQNGGKGGSRRAQQRRRQNVRNRNCMSA